MVEASTQIRQAQTGSERITFRTPLTTRAERLGSRPASNISQEVTRPCLSEVASVVAEFLTHVKLSRPVNTSVASPATSEACAHSSRKKPLRRIRKEDPGASLEGVSKPSAPPWKTSIDTIFSGSPRPLIELRRRDVSGPFSFNMFLILQLERGPELCWRCLPVVTQAAQSNNRSRKVQGIL